MSQIKFNSIEALIAWLKLEEIYVVFENKQAGFFKTVFLLFQLLPVDASNEKLRLTQKQKIQRDVILKI